MSSSEPRGVKPGRGAFPCRTVQISEGGPGAKGLSVLGLEYAIRGLVTVESATDEHIIIIFTISSHIGHFTFRLELLHLRP